MNKHVMLVGAALCLSAAACSNDNGPRASSAGYQTANNQGYNGYYDESSQDNFYRGDRAENYNDRFEQNARFWFDKIDRNHKGYITAADMRRHADHAFRKMDANRDGKVTFEEFQSFKEMQFQRKQEHRRMRRRNAEPNTAPQSMNSNAPNDNMTDENTGDQQ